MGRYRVMIFLQMIRALIAEMLPTQTYHRPQLDHILRMPASVEEPAAENELTASALICRRVTDRLEPLARQQQISSSLVFGIGDWAETLQLYVWRALCRRFANMVVLPLNDPVWRLALPNDEQPALMDQLMQRAAP